MTVVLVSFIMMLLVLKSIRIPSYFEMISRKRQSCCTFVNVNFSFDASFRYIKYFLRLFFILVELESEELCKLTDSSSHHFVIQFFFNLTRIW